MIDHGLLMENNDVEVILESARSVTVHIVSIDSKISTLEGVFLYSKISFFFFVEIIIVVNRIEEMNRFASSVFPLSHGMYYGMYYGMECLYYGVYYGVFNAGGDRKHSHVTMF